MNAAGFSPARGSCSGTSTGVTVQVRLRVESTTAAETGNDTAVFIGLTPEAESKGVQSSESIAGISISYSRKNGEADVALVMKDAQSSEPNCRGDDKGNCFQYQYPAVKIPGSGNNCPLDVTLTLDNTTIHGKVGGTSFSQHFPSRLTKRVWENGAYFIFQQMNQGSGRAQSIVDEIRIDYTALATTKGRDTRKDSLGKDRYPDRVIIRAKKQVSGDAFCVGGITTGR